MLDISSEIGGVLASDPLSEVLQDFRITGVSYGRCELTRPWGISFPPQKAARFHFVATGQCWLQSPTREWILLKAGDVALLPFGTGHSLADEINSPTRPLLEFPLQEIGDKTYRLSGGGGGKAVLLFCCSVHFEEPTLHPLLELMPSLLLVRGGTSDDATFLPLLEIMAEEVLAQRVGAATVLTRLADVLITRVIRAWVEAQREDTTGWLAAIRDPKVGRALSAIHRHPGHPWSVKALAAVAQESRSTFSERFTTVVGVSPARYLAKWRMHIASGWLRGERLNVAEVASRLGYESEASFSRAFKRLVGVPPSALRRSGLQAEEVVGKEQLENHISQIIR